MNGYLVSQAGKVRHDFYRIFNRDFAPFYDCLMSAAFGRIWMDLVAFDDFLQEQFGDYTERGLSMKDLIIEKYGQEGFELINKLI
jgi:hypothetical protein